MKTFQKKQSNESIAEISAKGRTLEEILIEEKIVLSKSDLRRLIEVKAVTNFETKKIVTLEQSKISVKNGVYKIGKSRIVRIV